MALTWAIPILLSVVVNYFCSANQHKFGYGSYDHQYFYKELTHDRGNGLKNYTLIFNFLGEGIKEVTYVDIDIADAHSEGQIKVYSDNKVNANININGVRNFSATISVRGESSLPYGYLDAFRQLEEVDLKSLTFVYVRRASTSSKANAQNSIGNRRPGDRLLHFESRNVTNFNRFPSRVFSYSGKEYITYVGFSFNSPTAIAMVNTSFVGEHEFNGIVYDMNTEHFMANMTVYGIKSKNRPKHFSGIL